MLSQLRDDFDHHVKEEMATYNKILDAQNANIVAISALTNSVATLTDNVSALTVDTRDIIRTYKDFQGVARVGNGVQKFVIWCLKWGGIIGGVGVGISWIIEHFSKHPPG